MQYPEVPGQQRTDTSIAAAPDPESAATLRNIALSIIRRCPCTADEVARIMQRHILSVRPRVTELKRMGLIEDSGERRKNVSGKKAIVWKAKV